MQKISIKLAALGATAVFACGVFAAGGAAATSLAAAAGADDYYAPITATKGDELLGQIHDLITTTHTHYTSYDDSKKYGPTTDPALNGETGVVEFYTHETIAEWTLNGGDPGRWNREHVWAQALSKDSTGRQLWGREGGGADLHHLRPSEVKMNSDRGDKKYGEVVNGSPIYSRTTSGANSQIGGYQAGGVFEPLDFAKGDVARIVLYVYTHYNTYANVHGTTNGASNSQEESYFGTLPITNIVSAASEEAAFDLLLEWNELDPVDAIETTRNEAVFNIQHNRNPFIDHPEYAAAVWGDAELGGGTGEQGGTGEPEHTHSYGYRDLDEANHTKYCTGCEEVNVSEPHVYDSATDTTCNLCGHERTVGGGTQGGSGEQGGTQGGTSGGTSGGTQGGEQGGTQGGEQGGTPEVKPESKPGCGGVIGIAEGGMFAAAAVAVIAAAVILHRRKG